MLNVEGLENILASGRDSTLLRFSLGKHYTDNANFTLAVQHLEKCIAIDRNYSVAWKLLGKAYLGLNDPTKAAEVWRNGIEIARINGQLQAEKEMSVFLRRVERDFSKIP